MSAPGSAGMSPTSGASRLARAAFAIGVIWFVAVLAVGLPAEAHFLVYGLAGSAVIVLASTPTLATGGALLAGSLVLLSMRVGQWEGLAAGLKIEPGLPLAYVGLASMGLLAIRELANPVSRGVMIGAIGIPTFIFLTEPFHRLVILATPETVDPTLLRLDLALFGDATFRAGRLLAGHPWLRAASTWSYVALGLVGASVYCLSVRGRAGGIRPSELLWSWAVAALVAGVCYPLVPAVGPRWVFSEWPFQLPALTMTTAVPTAEVPRNAMPSMHAAWALLVCWGARGVPRSVWLFLVPWLALTLLATLGGGGHYLIDLVAALPVVWVAAWVGRRLSSRTAGGPACKADG